MPSIPAYSALLTETRFRRRLFREMPEPPPLKGGLGGPQGAGGMADLPQPKVPTPAPDPERNRLAGFERDLKTFNALTHDIYSPDASTLEIGQFLFNMITQWTNWEDEERAAIGEKGQRTVAGIMLDVPMARVKMPLGPQAKPPQEVRGFDDVTPANARMITKTTRYQLINYAQSRLLYALKMGVINSRQSEAEKPVPTMENIQPSLGVVELLATTDANVFEHVMDSIGLSILGMRDGDPLRTTAMPEDIDAVASELTESADEYHDLDPYLASIKDLAEALGYIVSIAA